MEIKTSCEGRGVEPKNVVMSRWGYLCSDSRREKCPHHVLYCRDEGDKNLCGFYTIPDDKSVELIDEEVIDLSDPIQFKEQWRRL